MTMTDITNKVFDYIRQHCLIEEGEKILLAISGGADSVCLLAILNELINSGKLKSDISIAHMNHQLRGEHADSDEQYVKDLADKFKLPCYSISIDVQKFAQDNKQSFETAARDLRKSEFAKLASKLGCSKIATAHHRNDNAETLIHRMIRGTGFTGLAGIWTEKYFAAENITYIRPLLSLTREEIVSYLEANNISWQHDHTNDLTIYTRNKIRHLILPELQNGSKTDLVEKLNCLADKCCGLEQTIQKQAKMLYRKININNEQAEINLETLQTSPLVQLALIKHSLAYIGFGLHRLDSVHIQNILELLNSPESKSIELPLGYTASLEYGKLYLRKQPNNKPLDAITVDTSGITYYGEYHIETNVFDFESEDFEKFKTQKDSHTEWFDYEKIKGKIEIRPRIEGDTFKPIGLRGTKKIGKFLTAAKVPGHIRESVIIFTDEKKIIWVYPVRSCQETRITSSTQKVMEIKVKKWATKKPPI